MTTENPPFEDEMLRPIEEIGAKLGLGPDDLVRYGKNIAKVDKQLVKLRKQAASTKNRQIIEQYNNLNAQRRAMHELHHKRLEGFYAVDAKVIKMLNTTAQLMVAAKKRHLELGKDKSVLPAIKASGGKLRSAPDTPDVVLRARKQVARTRKDLGS